jgi:hypothetical protein
MEVWYYNCRVAMSIRIEQMDREIEREREREIELKGSGAKLVANRFAI